MSMKDFVYDALRRQGKAQGLALQERSADMTGTQLIAEEDYIPEFNPEKDYSSWKPGFPVQDEGQVWTLIQPHDASHYDGRPSTLRALWGLAHTTDPAKAKEYVAPYGTSGMYMKDECCRFDDIVYRSIVDNNVYSPADYPTNWEVVEV